MKETLALSGVALLTLGAYLQFGPITLMIAGAFLLLEAKLLK